MARKKGQTYTAEQKAKIVLEMIKEEKTIGQLVTKYKITGKTLQNWKSDFLKNASKVFETDKNDKLKKEELNKLKQENDLLSKDIRKDNSREGLVAGKATMLGLI